MATTEHFYTGNGSTTTFAFTFPYLSNDAVKIELDNVLKTENSSGQTNNDYTISNTNIVFNSAPGSGVIIHIYRNTNVDSAQAQYAAGSSIRAADLNNNQTQLLYSAQEAQSQQVRTTDIKDGAINSAKIEDGTIVNADINGSAAIEGSKLQASSGSVAGSMSSANFTKLAGIETAATADQTAAEIRTLVESASDSNVFTDADHTKLNGIEASATADQTASEIKTLIASSPLDSSHLAANSVGTSEIADAELTTLAGMQSGTASILAGGTALTSTLSELNLLDGKSIVTTISSPTDVQLPTAQAVEERIVDLVTDVGGFRPIANETSFPTTNPDPEDNAGTIVSIRALASNITSNGSGVATIANGAGSGNTVTINGMANNDTIEAGKGILVETTSTLHTYTFHRETLAPADINNAKTAVDDFNERYRVNAGEPASNNDEGDLVYDTNADKMKVYDSTTSAWKEVTSTGQFKYLFLCPAGGSGAPTFNGSIATYDLREVSNSGSSASVTNAAQLIVSVNGVVQKANTGTSAPAEGFAMVDANTIIFGSNIPSGASVFVIQIGSAISIPTPGDDTCSTVKIQNGAITEPKLSTGAVTQAKVGDQAINEAKLQISNAPTNGYVLTAQSGNTGGMTWQLAAAGATGGNSNGNGVFWENENTVTHDYTIQNNHNAGSFGPITINNGVTVTVGSGENWTIV